MGRVAKIESAGYGNVVEAAAGGASDGLRLALNVAAMLIAFLGLIAVLDWLLGFVHDDLSVKAILGTVFWPIAAVMGVPSQDITSLAQLLGTKITMTELIAYKDMTAMVRDHAITPRTELIASFALCGFASFGSLAIQLGGIGAMAPERRYDLARLGLRAMCGGAIATCITACTAGVLSAGGGSS
jgi:CNT family concentrative nucleoside transporter